MHGTIAAAQAWTRCGKPLTRGHRLHVKTESASGKEGIHGEKQVVDRAEPLLSCISGIGRQKKEQSKS